MNAEVMSALLLDLYRYSRELPIADFQGQALERLQAQLRFDSAWWGVSARDRLIHSSFPFGLPRNYGEFYRDWVSDTDTLAVATLACPGTTVRFSPDDIECSPGLNQLNRNFGIQESLCTAVMLPALDLVAFLSIYRHGNGPQFTEEERRFLELIVPHLWATWTSNWTSNWLVQLEPGRSRNAANRVAHAITDQCGILHRAEPDFIELMRTEWPDWRGPDLPAPLRQAIHRQGQHVGKITVIRHFPVCGLILLEMRTRSALESLTPRELTVAVAFGEGQSYKRIAGHLGLSPATVRHYLRSIYSKANISNKAELANLLSEALAMGTSFSGTRS